MSLLGWRIRPLGSFRLLARLGPCILCLLPVRNVLHHLIIDEHGKIKGTSTEVDQLYKSFILCVIELVCNFRYKIVYFIGYIIYNISHMYAVSYNINGSNYSSLTALTTIFTVVSLIGWLVTNTNTYKYENKN
jgi:hypothetical protein